MKLKNISALITWIYFVGEIAAQKDPHFYNSRTTIVHLFEWKYEDIAKECENWLSKKGFGGVQISPPAENMVINDPKRPWWERYQPVSYGLTTRSGDEKALADMLQRCNAVGVRVYADIILNHMAAFQGKGTGGSSCDPPNKSYPAVPLTSQNFHKSCPLNTWQDVNVVRNCELNALPDLDQTQDHVRQKQIEFMNHLVDLGIAGFRVDAAKLMWPNDLKYIYEHVKDLNPKFGFKSGARPFIYQEVVDYGNEPIKQSEYSGFGAVLEFKAGKDLGLAFQGKASLADLKDFHKRSGYAESGDAVAFIDNHDNQRTTENGAILTYKNPKPYKAAIAFLMAYPYSTTRLMSSFNFDSNDVGPPMDANGNIVSPGFNEDNTCTNGWVCEHRWREIFAMVQFRNVVKNSPLVNWWSNGDKQVAFGRQGKGFVAFTIAGDINRELDTGLPAGTYCDVISGDFVGGKCTGRTVVVGDNGKAMIPLTEKDFDSVLALHINAKME